MCGTKIFFSALSHNSEEKVGGAIHALGMCYDNIPLRF